LNASVSKSRLPVGKPNQPGTSQMASDKDNLEPSADAAANQPDSHANETSPDDAPPSKPKATAHYLPAITVIPPSAGASFSGAAEPPPEHDSYVAPAYARLAAA